MIEKDRECVKNASTVKIAIWYVIGNFFARGVTMLSTPVFTRLMSKGEYGEFSNFVSWENIIVILATLDFSASIIRAKYDFNEKIDEYISSILLFGNFITLGLYFFIEFQKDYFMKLFSMDFIYIRMLFIYLLFEPAFSYLQVKHRIYKKYKFFVAFSISSAVIRTGVSVILVLIFEDKLMGRISGYLIPVTLLYLCLWAAALVKGKKISWNHIKYGCKISIPLIPHALSGIVLANSDRIMIRHYCGSEATAIYSLGYTVSTVASLLWTSMNQAWTPWLYDNMNIRNKKEIIQNSRIYLGIFLILLIGVFLTAPEMIMIFGGEQYHSAKYVMPPVILACAFQFVYSMYVNIEIFSKKTFMISLGTMGAAILNLLLNERFIPKYGYIAAVYTTTVGYLVLLFFHYFIVKLIIKEYADIYDTKFNFFMLFLAGLLCVFSFVMYRCNLARYAIVFIYLSIIAVGIYKYRWKIKSLLKY